MSNLIGYNLISNDNLKFNASSVKTSMRHGWIPKSDVSTYKQEEANEPDSASTSGNKNKKKVYRQKSWIPWSLSSS